MDWNPNVLSPIQLENYAKAVRNCFVDGTVRPISRPDENQRVVYNRHKRVHGLKFKSVVIPNGLIAHLYGSLAIIRSMCAEVSFNSPSTPVPVVS